MGGVLAVGRKLLLTKDVNREVVVKCDVVGSLRFLGTNGRGQPQEQEREGQSWRHVRLPVDGPDRSGTRGSTVSYHGREVKQSARARRPVVNATLVEDLGRIAEQVVQQAPAFAIPGWTPEKATAFSVRRSVHANPWWLRILQTTLQISFVLERVGKGTIDEE